MPLIVGMNRKRGQTLQLSVVDRNMQAKKDPASSVKTRPGVMQINDSDAVTMRYHMISCELCTNLP